MKKLILSLFAIATIFVACDKEAVDIQEPLAVELEEVDATIDMDVDYDVIIARLTGKEFSSKGNASSARTTANVACADDARDGLTIGGSTDYISYEFTTIGGVNYGVIRSEAETFTAPFNRVVNLVFVNLGSNNVGVYVNGSSVATLNIPAFTPLFDNSILANAFVEVLDANFVYTGDSNVADAGLSCIYAGQYYEVTPAPFPLNGFLATLNDVALPAGMSSANYAGTSEAAVRAAIEADIVGSN